MKHSNMSHGDNGTILWVWMKKGTMQKKTIWTTFHGNEGLWGKEVNVWWQADEDNSNVSLWGEASMVMYILVNDIEICVMISYRFL